MLEISWNSLQTYENEAYIDDKHEEIQLKDLVPYLMYGHNMGKAGSHHLPHTKDIACPNARKQNWYSKLMA